ncbi:MAG: hypothetical protein DSM106950_03440 [Stigonema ocellatum SAG 48.90 = DSM 106950]|nr:hypothetical protein [Stigonema ocellatum SAG 48.90 = DSM 106950]
MSFFGKVLKNVKTFPIKQMQKLLKSFEVAAVSLDRGGQRENAGVALAQK